MDTLRAHLVPAGRFLSAWIHNGQGSDIESSMIDGQIRDARSQGADVDEAAVIAEADRVGRRIWSEVQKGRRGADSGPAEEVGLDTSAGRITLARHCFRSAGPK